MADSAHTATGSAGSSGAAKTAAFMPRMGTAQMVYFWLASVSATCLIISDIVGIKLFSLPLPFSFPVPWQEARISSVDHTVGMLMFPVTFVLTDVLNEFYGKALARRVVYLSFAMALLSFSMITLAQAMPRLDAPYNVDEAAFDHVLGGAKVMYIASLSAYAIGSLADIVIFGWLKRLTHGRHVWLRSTGSTVVSQVLDSFVVSYLAFSLGRRLFPSQGTLPAPFVDVLKIAATGYLLKFCIAVASTPVIYFIKAMITKVWGIQPLPPEGEAV